MPADFFIDTRRRIVFTKATHVFSRLEAFDHMDRLLAHPEFHPDFSQLADFRQISSLSISHDDVRALAARRIFSERSRRAFVVSGDLQFGVARIFGTYRDMQGEDGIMIFRAMDKALAWLSLQEEPDHKLFAGLNSPTIKD